MRIENGSYVCLSNLTMLMYIFRKIVAMSLYSWIFTDKIKQTNVQSSEFTIRFERNVAQKHTQTEE